MTPPVPELQRKEKNKKLKLGGDGRGIGGLVLLGGVVAAGTLTALVTNHMRKKEGEPINCSTETSEAQPKIPSTLTTNQEPQGEISEAIAVVEEAIVAEAAAEIVENGGTVVAREIASREIEEVNMAVAESTELGRKKMMGKYAVAGGVFLFGTAFGYLLANIGKGNRTVSGTEDDGEEGDVTVSGNCDGNGSMESREAESRESAEKIQSMETKFNDRRNVEGSEWIRERGRNINDVLCHLISSLNSWQLVFVALVVLLVCLMALMLHITRLPFLSTILH